MTGPFDIGIPRIGLLQKSGIVGGGGGGAGAGAIIGAEAQINAITGEWVAITMSPTVSSSSTVCAVPHLGLIVWIDSTGDVYSANYDGTGTTLRHSFSSSNGSQRLAHYPGEDRVYVGHISSTTDDRVYFLSNLTAGPGTWTYNGFNDAARCDDLAIGPDYVYAFDTISTEQIRALNKTNGSVAFTLNTGSDCLAWDELNVKVQRASVSGVFERDPDLTNAVTWVTLAEAIIRGGLACDLQGYTYRFDYSADVIKKFDRANGDSQTAADGDVLTWIPVVGGSTEGINFASGLSVESTIAAPTGVLAVTGSGANEIDASWDSVPGADRYALYYLDSNGKRRYDGTVTGTSKTVTTDASGVSRTIEVQAIEDNTSGSAPASAQASATTG